MADFVATRNTCFALTSAIEDDFRSLILAVGDPDGNGGDLLPVDVKEMALKRRTADLRMDSIASNVRESDLLPYIDFADIAKILESRLAPRSEAHKEWLTSAARRLLSLTPARNRVCHTRPLETEDLPTLVDFASSLVNAVSPFPFKEVSHALSRLSAEPGFVLTLQIPSFWRDKPRIHNNLPIPEFDDTGFVGRHADRMHVLKLLKSHYPVVTIVGEGGVGKTALALRCLYDLLDDPVAPYDAIVWVSLKTAALTQAGVRDLTGAITSTLGLLSEVAKQLGVPHENIQRTEADYISEISEYLELYRIIVAIDNLETISSGPLRDLLLNVPAHSKLLLTSRVGVGEFEARYPLQGLDEKAAISLFRAHAKILSVGELLKLDDGNIKGYCKRLFNNPLLLKWFVASVSRGANPLNLIDKDGQNFLDALSFCFENLFDRLGNSERSVISCLACARKSLTSAEIHFLLPELTGLEAEIALSALHNSSIVIRSNKGADGFEYALSESAATFVSTQKPPSADFFKTVQERLRKLRQILTEESILEARYEFDPFFVRSGSGRDERICATYLRRALDSLRNSDFETSRAEVAQAKRLAVQSGEVWRIAALVEERAGELYKAVDSYEQSIELDPRSKISRYCYGMFLMTDMDDLQGALEQFMVADELDPGAPPVLTAKAMALNRIGRFEEAAAIHEQLLPTLKTRGRRWRLTGTDQAADCYRRWAHRAWELKEYAEAKQHIKRAMSILLESAERDDLDNKLLQRAAKVVNEALSKRELVCDRDFVEYVVVTLERFSDLSHGASIPILTEAAWVIKGQDITDVHRERLVHLDKSMVGAGLLMSDTTKPLSSEGISSKRDRMLGKVHNLSEQKKYGFIQGDDGHRWFFHSLFLKPGTKWDSIKAGMRVSFHIGQNSQGSCAVDVQKVE